MLGWAVAVVALTSGAGRSLSDDALVAALFVCPLGAFLSVEVLRPRQRVPSAALWSGPWSEGPPAVGFLVHAYALAVIAGSAATTAAYAGAAWSALGGGNTGLARLVGGPSPYLDWWVPLAGGVRGIGTGFLLVLTVFVPLGALLDAHERRHDDPLETRRLLAFVLGVVGIGALVGASCWWALARLRRVETCDRAG